MVNLTMYDGRECWFFYDMRIRIYRLHRVETVVYWYVRRERAPRKESRARRRTDVLTVLCLYRLETFCRAGLDNLDNTMSFYSKKNPQSSFAKNFKQIIGGVISPTLGAFPDAILISVTTETQADVAAGMSMLVSSNALLLTVPWLIALYMGRKNLFRGSGMITTLNHPEEETHPLTTLNGWRNSGIMVWTSVMDQAQIMLLTLFPFIVTQLLAFHLKESDMTFACLIMAIVCMFVYAFLLWFQLSDIGGTSSIFDTYRAAINKFDDQMLWIRATGFYGAATPAELEKMFLKVQINAPQFAGVEMLRNVKSQNPTVDSRVRGKVRSRTMANMSPPVESKRATRSGSDSLVTSTSGLLSGTKVDDNVIPVSIVKTPVGDDTKNGVSSSDIDDIEEMRRRSDFSELMKNLTPNERRNMRMRTWALMDRTPIAQMHTILRVWVLATENQLFEDLRDKYQKRLIRRETSTHPNNSSTTSAATTAANSSASRDVHRGGIVGLFMACGLSETISSITYAIAQIMLSMFIVFVFADPLVNSILSWAKWAAIPSVIPVMFVPLFTSGEVVSAYNWSKGKHKGKLSMVYTSLYSAVAMNNCLVFGAFLGMIYVNDLTWDFAGESIGLLVSSAVVGSIGAFRFTYTMTQGAFVICLFPTMALFIYLFSSTESVRDAALASGENITDDIEDDGPLRDGAEYLWYVLAIATTASLSLTLYEIMDEYVESRKSIAREMSSNGKQSWGMVKTTMSTTRTLRKMKERRKSVARAHEERSQEQTIHRVISQTLGVQRVDSLSKKDSLAKDKRAGDVKIEMRDMSSTFDQTHSLDLASFESADTSSKVDGEDRVALRKMDSTVDEKLRRTFERYDTDHDMELDAANLMTAVDELLGIKLNIEHVRDMIRSIDTDNSGTINFREFRKLFMAAGTDLSPSSVLDKAFRLFAAPDGSGPENDPNYITVKNLDRVARMCGVIIQKEDLREMIAEANIDGDNRISRDEFRVLLQVLELDRVFCDDTL